MSNPNDSFSFGNPIAATSDTSLRNLFSTATETSLRDLFLLLLRLVSQKLSPFPTETCLVELALSGSEFLKCDHQGFKI